MTHCKEIFAALSEYLDKELPEPLCEEMRRHIEDCPPCVEFIHSLERSIEMCRSAQAGPPAPRLDEDTRQRLLETYRAALDARG